MEKIMDAKKWRNLIVAIAIFVLGWILPGMGTITKEGMFALGAMISLVFAMATGVDAWFVLLAIFAFAFNKNLSVTVDLFPGIFGNYILWFIVLCFWYVSAVAKTGFLDFFTSKLLKLKIATKGYYWLMATLCATAFIATGLTQASIAVLSVMLGVLRKLQKEFDMKLNNPWVIATGFGVCMCVEFGALLMPFNNVFFMYAGFLSSTYGWINNTNAVAYTLQQLISAVVFIAATILVTKYLIRPKLDAAKLGSTVLVDGDVKIKFDKAMGAVIATIIILVVIVGIPSLVPATSIVNKIATRFNITGAFAIGCIILSLVKNSKGERCMDFLKIASGSTNWTMLFYIGAIIYVGNFISEPDAGIIAQIATWCRPIQNLSPILLISALGILAAILTNATNNMVVALMLAPIGYSVLGMDSPMATVFTVTLICCSIPGCALPSGSTMGAVLHTQNDMFTTGKLIKYGYPLAIVFAIGQCIGFIVTRNFY